MAKTVTNGDLFARMDALRIEMKQDISVAVNTVAVSQGRLEKKFDDLEAGRLTRAEANIQDLRVAMIKTTDGLDKNQAVLSTKVIVLWAAASSLLSILGGVIVTRLLK